jgi:hypothetical protein
MTTPLEILKAVANAAPSIAGIVEAAEAVEVQKAEAQTKVDSLNLQADKLARLVDERGRKLQGIEDRIQKYREAAG